MSLNNKTSVYLDNDGYIDYLVRLEFYRNNSSPSYEGGSSILDLLSMNNPYISAGYWHAHYEFEYVPPWVDEDLLEYSLKGLDSIKV